MQISDNITLDLWQPAIVTVHAKQNDNTARVIAAALTVNGAAYTIPQDAVAMFRARKPDNTVAVYTTGISVNGATVSVPLEEQVMTAAGRALCEINLYNPQSQKLTTFCFVLDVEASAVSDDEVASTDYFNILTDRIDALLTATAHPPYIGDNGKWYVWDTETNTGYKDTGVDATGPQGEPGEAATIQVGTVTTGAPGTEAQVTNTGTPTAAVFDFIIPKGEPGDSSVQSVNGKTGAVVLSAQDVNALPDAGGTISGDLAVTGSVTIDGADVASSIGAAQSTANTANTTANAAHSLASAAMPIAGGTFTGAAAAVSANLSGRYLRNSYVDTASGAAVSTNYLWFRRK